MGSLVITVDWGNGQTIVIACGGFTTQVARVSERLLGSISQALKTSKDSLESAK
jgi:hypothetical protein